MLNYKKDKWMKFESRERQMFFLYLAFCLCVESVIVQILGSIGVSIIIISMVILCMFFSLVCCFD